MAKTTAPLLSFDAGGQIGKAQVYSKWRGISVARRYVVPGNPQTIPQQHTRGVFSWLNGVWKTMDAALQAPWLAYSKGKPLTDRNAFQKFNVQPLRGVGTTYATDATGYIASPGVNGGLAAGGIAASSSGAGALTATLTAPTLPTGWAITNAHAVCFVDKTVWNSVDFTTHYESDNTDPYAPAFTGLPTGNYDVFAFFEYTKPDGSTAYSPSLHAQQAVA